MIPAANRRVFAESCFQHMKEWALTHTVPTHTHTHTNRNLRQAFPHMREGLLRKKSGMTVYTTEVRVIFDIFWTLGPLCV